MENIQTKKSYEDVLLQRWQNFGFLTDKGWVFAKVLDYEDTAFIYERFNALAAGSGMSTIGKGSASEFHILKDSNDNKLLWEDEKNRVLQAFIGISPIRLRLFLAMPDDVKRGGLSDIPVGGLTSETIGWIDGRDSPFDVPGIKSEIIVPPKIKVKQGLFNPESFAVMPRLSMKIRRMEVGWYDPDKTQHKQMIENFAIGKVPCHFWSAGIGGVKYKLSAIGVDATDLDTSLGFSGTVKVGE